ADGVGYGAEGRPFICAGATNACGPTEAPAVPIIVVNSGGDGLPLFLKNHSFCLTSNAESRITSSIHTLSLLALGGQNEGGKFERKVCTRDIRVVFRIAA